jgi:multiple sugar transport system substrate-binding protein
MLSVPSPRGLAVLGLVLVLAGCTSSAPTTAPTNPPAASHPASVAPPPTAAVTQAPAATPTQAGSVAPTEAVTAPPPSVEAATPTPAPTSNGSFKDVNVNLLTFNGPQIAEPLQRRAPDWEALTGGHINVIAVPFQTIYDKALLDASTGTNSFDAYVFNPQWMGDFVGPGYLKDLTDSVNTDPQIQWQDIAPFFRDFNATYNGKVYAIPLDGDFHMVYYRKDLLDRDGLQAPATWDDYMTIAQKYNGQDLNEDGQPDYGSCIAAAPGQQSYWWIISIAAGLLQAEGTSEGAFFNTSDMTPLFGPNEAMDKALALYNGLTQYSPPEILNLGVGDTRGLFTTGRCALSMDWGDIGPLSTGTYVQDKFAATITPGWKQVLDRGTGKLVDCDATTCPNAVDGVNYAPFASFGGWSGAINSYITDKDTSADHQAQLKKQQEAAYDFLSYMSAPAQSSIDVTLGKTGYNPFRMSEFTDTQTWIDSGMSPTAVTNYLGAIQNSLQSPNFVLDMRIPLTKQYEQDVLDKQVSSFLAGEQDAATTEQNIADGWNQVSDSAPGGKDAQLAAYISSLGIQK